MGDWVLVVGSLVGRGDTVGEDVVDGTIRYDCRPRRYGW